MSLNLKRSFYFILEIGKEGKKIREVTGEITLLFSFRKYSVMRALGQNTPITWYSYLGT